MDEKGRTHMMFGWIVIVAIIILIVGSRKRHIHEMYGEGKQSSMGRLKERYINGEIDEATYTNKKKVITQ